MRGFRCPAFIGLSVLIPVCCIADASREKVLRSFEGAYAAPDTVGPNDEPSDAVPMDPVEVTAPYQYAGRAIEERRRKLDAEKFHFQEGGNFIKRTGKRVTSELRFQFEPTQQTWEILKFSW